MKKTSFLVCALVCAVMTIIATDAKAQGGGEIDGDSTFLDVVLAPLAAVDHTVVWKTGTAGAGVATLSITNPDPVNYEYLWTGPGAGETFADNTAEITVITNVVAGEYYCMVTIGGTYVMETNHIVIGVYDIPEGADVLRTDDVPNPLAFLDPNHIAIEGSVAILTATPRYGGGAVQPNLSSYTWKWFDEITELIETSNVLTFNPVAMGDERLGPPVLMLGYHPKVVYGEYPTAP